MTEDNEVRRAEREAEKDLEGTVFHAAGALASMAEEFSDCVSLFWMCRKAIAAIEPDGSNFFAVSENNTHWSKLSFVPAKYAPFVVYNFYHAMAVFKSAVNAAPKVNARTDWKMVKHAQNLFSGRFPGFADIRDSFGHQGEFLDPRKRWKVMVTGPSDPAGVNLGHGASMAIGASIGPNGEIGTTFNGRHVTYSLTPESTERLITIAAHMRAAYEPDFGQSREERAAIHAESIRNNCR